MNFFKFFNKDILTKLLLAAILTASFSISGCNKKTAETKDTMVSSKIKIKITKDQMERPNLREDFEKAKKQNSDTVAWISIPGTDINYPVVQDLQNRSTSTCSEDYYAHRDFLGNRVAIGKESAIMSHKANAISPFEKLSNNVVISGHNVNLDDNPNGKMFAPLNNFKDIEFSKKTPYIFLTTEDKDLVYEVFASYNSEERFGYFLPKESKKEMAEMIKEAKKRSNFIYDDVKVSDKDKVLTLYTCTYSFGRWKSLGYYRVKYVVQARLLSDEEKLRAVDSIRENPSPTPVYYSYCARCNKEMTVEKCSANYGLCDSCKNKK